MDWRYDSERLSESMIVLIPRHTGGVILDMQTHSSNNP